MKIIIFLLCTITPHLHSELVSKLKDGAQILLEHGPTKIIQPIKVIHEKIFFFPQDLENSGKIPQQLIEESISKNADLNLNTTTWLKFLPNLNKTYPPNFDWREHGAVSPVKFQGAACSSDWAFSAVGAIEGQNFRKNRQLQSLSVQQVLDCSKNFHNDGCDGGFIHQTFEYVKAANGIATDTSYPYQYQNGVCKFKENQAAVKIRGYVYVGKGDERALEAAVASVGPIAVGLGIKPKAAFFSYKNGIYFDEECGKEAEDLTFGALVVGYGKDTDGRKFWLVKSSFGTRWGLDGYMKLAKDEGNHCGIATYASFPLV